jgi:surface antigen
MGRRIVTKFFLLVTALSATLAVGAAPSMAKTIELKWAPTAAQFWSADGSAVKSLFHNGQCTQWALTRRPDVVRDGVEAIVSQEIASGQPEDMGDWDARYWAANARLAHIPTGHTPRAHALIVFQPGALGAGWAGHIAYVQKVYGDGSFLISEMHAPVLWRVSHRHLPADDARLGGVTFIY